MTIKRLEIAAHRCDIGLFEQNRQLKEKIKQLEEENKKL